MTYQKILNLLQSSRDDTAIRDATTARRFFEGNMDSKLARKVFTYKKKGITHDCKQDKAIAQKWRDLIHNDPNVRAQWEMMEQQLRVGFELGSDAAEEAGC